jgi:hypothetical protein
VLQEHVLQEQVLREQERALELRERALELRERALELRERALELRERALELRERAEKGASAPTRYARARPERPRTQSARHAAIEKTSQISDSSQNVLARLVSRPLASEPFTRTQTKSETAVHIKRQTSLQSWARSRRDRRKGRGSESVDLGILGDSRAETAGGRGSEVARSRSALF